MITVDKISTTFRINVNNRYFAINGIVDEVGGRILETSNKNTTIDRRTEIVRVTFSVESAGKKKTLADRKAISIVGMIRTTV
jgi:hypothetical protein